MLHNKIQDGFGRHYKLHTSRDGVTPTGLSSKRLTDPASAERFVRSLRVSENYWRRMISSVGSEGRTGGRHHSRIEEQIAKLMVFGKIRVFDITDVVAIASNISQYTFKTSNKNTAVQILPANAQFMAARGNVKSFRNAAEARQYVTQLGASEDQLKGLVDGITVTRRPAGNPTTIDLVADAIVEGKVIVRETLTNGPHPKESGNSTEAETDTTSMPASSPSDLGPHASAAATNAVKEDEEPKEEKVPVCEMVKFSLRCDHYSKRGYLLDAMKGEPNFNGVDTVIQVIGNEGKPDHINLAFAGTCVHGNTECPSLVINGDTFSETAVASPHKFPVLAPKPSREIKSFKDFLRYCMVPKLGSLNPQIYSVEAKGCEDIKSCEAKVHAFPTFKWSGNVSMGYTTKDDKGWELKAGLKGNIAKNTWSFEAGTPADFFPEIHAIIGPVVDRIKELSSKGAQLIPGVNNEQANKRIKAGLSSAVALAGDLELQEIEQSHKVDIGGNLALKLDPLIQADVSTDILDWVAAKESPIGKLIQEIRARAEKGVGNDTVNASAEIKLELTVTGGLTADLTWEKPAGKPWRSEKGKTSQGSASLLIGLKGTAKAEANVWFVKMAIGLELSLQSAKSDAEGIGAVISLWSTTVNEKPTLGGKVEFTGATIYFAYYAEISRREMTSDDMARNKGRGNSFGRKKNITAEDRTAKGSIEILSASRWPKQPDKYSIDELDL